MRRATNIGCAVIGGFAGAGLGSPGAFVGAEPGALFLRESVNIQQGETE
jgi:hypothetical protein